MYVTAFILNMHLFTVKCLKTDFCVFFKTILYLPLVCKEWLVREDSALAQHLQSKESKSI